MNTFTLTRTGSTEADLAVQLSLSGTATEGEDFISLASPFVILAGQTSLELTLLPVDDDAVESAETATLTIEPDVAYAIGSADSATAAICVFVVRAVIVFLLPLGAPGYFQSTEMHPVSSLS